MSRMRKFIAYPTRDKLALLEAAFWLAVGRLAIHFVPFRQIAARLGTHMAETPRAPLRGRLAELRRVQSTISIASRHLPWECKCLVQAITARMMLRRRRLPSTMYFGVRKGDDGSLEAHAWLRSGDIIVTGRRGMKRFAVVGTFS